MGWDRDLLDAINPDQPIPGLDLLMVLVTLFGYILPYGLLGFAVVRPGRRADAFAFWSALLVTEMLVAVLKVLVDRPRPDDVRLLVQLAESPSMPSGHAARAFAGALALWRLGPRWKYPLLGFALATLVSRVYVGAHYPSDVLLGGLVGLGVGLIAYAGTSWVHRELARAPDERSRPFERAYEAALFVLEIDYLYSLRLIGRLTQEQSRRLGRILPIWGQVRILFPIMMVLLGIVAFALLLPTEFPAAASCLGTYFVPIVGVEIGIPLCLTLGLPAWLVVSSIVYLDLWLSLFLLLNFDFLHRVPKLGAWLVRQESRGQALIQRRPWLLRVEFLGVALVTFTPLPGGGVIPGALVGRLIGMPRMGVWGAVMLGATARIGLIVYTVAGVIDRIR
jgi:undecaprenyl-diphosphatase